MLDFDDINHERNGLLLFLPIEHAFDRSHITFVFDSQLNQFVLKLLKPGLSELSFRDYIKAERNVDTRWLFKESYSENWKANKKAVHNLIALLDQKFKDYEGHPFAFHFSPVIKCYARCLAFQQPMAMLFAEENGWISKEGVKSPTMWSELGEEKIAFVSTWMNARAKNHSLSLLNCTIELLLSFMMHTIKAWSLFYKDLEATCRFRCDKFSTCRDGFCGRRLGWWT